MAKKPSKREKRGPGGWPRKAARQGGVPRPTGDKRDIPPNLLRSMERSHAHLDRALEEREFGSKEELNAFIRSFFDQGEKAPPRELSPLEQAQELIFDAWDERSPRRRVELARKALELSPDCVDAYVVLAEDAARSVEEICEYYRQGVEAGERALGTEFFEENAGHFWGVTSTRPYMRARWGLAQSIWALGDREAAVEHAQHMLRLNPNDNQGIRWFLIGWLLALDRDDDALRLLDKYDDGRTAFWLFSDALLRFRRLGPSEEARSALRRARQANPLVEGYLLGRRPMPDETPDTMGLGDESEAVCYAAEGLPVWRGTPAALEWLRDEVAAGPP